MNSAIWFFCCCVSIFLQKAVTEENTTLTQNNATLNNVFNSPAYFTNNTTIKDASLSVALKKTSVQNNSLLVNIFKAQKENKTASKADFVNNKTATTRNPLLADILKDIFGVLNIGKKHSLNKTQLESLAATLLNATAEREALLKGNSGDPTKKKITIMLSHDVKPNDNMGGLAAARVAVKQINENANILKDYQLRVYHFSAAVFNTGEFFKEFYQKVSEKEKETAMLLIGPIDSAMLTDTYSYLFKDTSLIQMNVNAFDMNLASTNKYPYIFSACQLENIFYPALVKFLRYFSWNNIGLFYMEEYKDFLYSKTALKFEKYAVTQGIEFLDIQRVPRSDRTFEKRIDSIRNKLRNFKDNDVRIMVVLAETVTMREFFCEAYKMGMYGEKYMYIVFFGESHNTWIEEQRTTFQCTKEQMYTINKNIIFQTRSAKANEKVVTVSSKTVAETWNLIEEDLNLLKGNFLRYRERLFYIYDSVWAFALALNSVIKTTPGYVENFSWKKKNDTRKRILADEISKANFQGASGLFKYIEENDERYRYGDTVMYRMVRQGNGTSIYVDFGAVNLTHTNINTSRLSYPVPLDGPKEIIMTKTFPLAVIVVLWVFSICGIILSIIFLVVNIYYGDVKFMKLSSPNVNSLICVGCMLFFIAVLTYGLDSDTIPKNSIPAMCNVTVLFLSIGFTLTFGALFSKTWRIYRIFTRSQSLRFVVIKDIHLFSIVFLLVLLDLLICIVWIGVSPFELIEQVIRTVENPDLDQIVISVVSRCQCQHQTHFFAAIFIYKGLLMLFGLFVAYETRSIKVEAINDSKNIGIAVYNFSVIASLSVIVNYLLYDTESYIEGYAVFAASIFEVAIVTLFLVFVPKIIMLSKNYDDPNFRNGRPVLNANLRSQIDSKSEGNNSTDTYGKKWARSETLSSGHYDANTGVGTLSRNKASLCKPDAVFKKNPNSNFNVKGGINRDITQ